MKLHSSPRRAIRASDLAKMGFCEQRLVYEKRLGERLTPQQVRSIDEGNAAHRRFFQQATAINSSVGSSQNKRWCFIACEVFGADAAETVALRALRDRYLRRSAVGRRLIIAYYQMSPAIARWLGPRANASRTVRFLLRKLLSAIEVFK